MPTDMLAPRITIFSIKVITVDIINTNVALIIAIIAKEILWSSQRPM